MGPLGVGLVGLVLLDPGSQTPDVHLLGNDAPVGVVVVRGDDVQVLHVLLDHVVDLPLPEDVVVSVAEG